jgi:hypothetical protein
MRFIRIHESNAHGNPNLYEFHIGIEEIKLLSGLLTNYLRHCPKGLDWKPEVRRAENMSKTIKKYACGLIDDRKKKI